MSNYVNKIIYDGNTLIDLTNDTVTEENLMLGETAHGADGKLIVGTLEVNEGGDTTAEDGLVDGTITEYSNDRVTGIRRYAFYYYSSLTTVNFPVATIIMDRAFHNCTSLTTASFPVATSIGNYAFSDCSSLTTADFLLVTSIGYNVFYRNYSLTTLILRNTAQVCTLLSTSAFTSCYHFYGTVNSTYNPDGLKDGYIYVPASLINSYKVATNWSTLATQFRALEDYTVDGTTTGELDESKI